MGLPGPWLFEKRVEEYQSDLYVLDTGFWRKFAPYNYKIGLCFKALIGEQVKTGKITRRSWLLERVSIGFRVVPGGKYHKSLPESSHENEINHFWDMRHFTKLEDCLRAAEHIALQYAQLQPDEVKWLTLALDCVALQQGRRP